MTRFDDLKTFVAEQLKTYPVPGMNVAVCEEDDVRVVSFGVTSAAHPLEVTHDTLFQIGSITKPFTATALMILSEQGKVDLEAPVRRYIPGFAVQDERAAAQATVQDLLTHTAGWVGDFFDDTGMGDDAIARYVERMAGLAQISPPGAHFSYNNSAFCLAGHVIEQASGLPYTEAIRTLIFEPLGMKMSFFHPQDAMVHRFAVGHTVTPDGPVVATPWPVPRASGPAGGIVTTAADLLRFARLHLNGGFNDDGERIVSEAGIYAMQERLVPVSEDDDGAIGLSWFLSTVDGIDFVEHGGGTNGQISLLKLVPEQNMALVLLTNANMGGPLNNAVAEYFVTEYLGLKHAKPQPVDPTPAQLAETCQVYARPFMDVELKMADGRLVAQLTIKQGFPAPDSPIPPPPPPFPAAFTAAGNVLILDGPYKDIQGVLLRDENGKIEYLRLGARLHRAQGSA